MWNAANFLSVSHETMWHSDWVSQWKTWLKNSIYQSCPWVFSTKQLFFKACPPISEIWIWSVCAPGSCSTLEGCYSKVTSTWHCARWDLYLWLFGRGSQAELVLQSNGKKNGGRRTPGRMTFFCGAWGLASSPTHHSEHWLGCVVWDNIL